jgi:bacterial leucyl aminopeptidase
MLLRNKNIFLLQSVLFASLLFSGYTPALAQDYFVIAPHHLIKKLKAPHSVLARINSLSFIKVNDAGMDALSEAKKTQGTTAPCVGFMDVTHEWTEFAAKKTSPKNAILFLKQFSPKQALLLQPALQYSIRYQDAVKQAFTQIHPDNMWNDLKELTQFPDRTAASTNGVKATDWIKSKVEELVKNSHYSDVKLYTLPTGKYKQDSLIVKIGNSDDPGIVIGAHIDTWPSDAAGGKPGADDDGTGTVTVLDIARTIFTTNKHFQKPIYLIWYAGEEDGLVGSQFVVSDFLSKKILIEAVMQLDMTGYSPKDDPDSIWLMEDYANKNLNKFIASLIKTYVNKPVKFGTCGYACSDHISWYLEGIAASFPLDSGADYPYIHTHKDTMDKLSLVHMTDFEKLALAFVIELAQPVT